MDLCSSDTLRALAISRLIVRAASAAQRAADYIRGKLTDESTQHAEQLDIGT